MLERKFLVRFAPLLHRSLNYRNFSFILGRFDFDLLLVSEQFEPIQWVLGVSVDLPLNNGSLTCKVVENDLLRLSLKRLLLSPLVIFIAIKTDEQCIV